MTNPIRAYATALLLAATLIPPPVHAQAGCDQGVVRLADRTGTVQICSAVAAQVPQLARQLGDVAKSVGDQQAQLRELTRLVKALNATSGNLGTERQGQLLRNLSSELGRAQKSGDDRARKTLDDLSDQFETLRDQLLFAMSQPASADPTRTALQGSLGDSIARLELRSASRQLDDLTERIKALQADLGAVKAGVNSANAKLDRITEAVDPDRAGDKCADLVCAVEAGASAKAVRRLIDKGARAAGNPINDGQLLLLAGLSSNPERFQVLDLLAGLGLYRNLRFNAMLTDRSRLTTSGATLAQDVALALHLRDAPGAAFLVQSAGNNALADWNLLAACLLRSSGGVTLRELAALMGDQDLFRYLGGKGVALSGADLRCEVRGRQSAGAVNLRIDAGSGTTSWALRDDGK